MIKKVFLKTREDKVNLYKIYSDADFIIKKIGTDELYEEAIDVEDAPFECEETNEKIETEEISEVEQKAQAYNILVGEVE